jgi:hypothetical protein
VFVVVVEDDGILPPGFEVAEVILDLALHQNLLDRGNRLGCRRHRDLLGSSARPGEMPPPPGATISYTCIMSGHNIEVKRDEGEDFPQFSGVIEGYPIGIYPNETARNVAGIM